MTFPLATDNRVIHSVPGSRKHGVSLADAQTRVRTALAQIDERLFVPLPGANERDDDPLLGPLLATCGPRLHVPARLAVLAPSSRFERNGRRVFAACPWANGVTGYVVAPSDFRPELAIWGYSESGLLRAEEYAMPSEWLLDLVEPLVGATADTNVDAHEMWETIEGDLPAPSSATVGARVPDGIRTRTTRGIVDREEQYVDGVRHGTQRWWSLLDHWPANAKPTDEPTFTQGPLVREGVFERGFAHGPFRFFNEHGQLTHEVEFVHGWPSGRCIVHPESTMGICEPATIDYDDGIPSSWSIPALAYTNARLDRANAPAATLAELANNGPVVVIDCATATDHTVKDDAPLPGTIIGIGVPGRGSLGSQSFEIVGDPQGLLARAYGNKHERLAQIMLLGPDGTFQGSGQLAQALKGLRIRLKKLA